MTIEVVIKVIVTGSTGWTDASTLENELTLLKNEYPELLVIHGNEPGAESLVENVCSAPGITTITVTANFAEYQDLAMYRSPFLRKGLNWNPSFNLKKIEICKNVNITGFMLPLFHYKTLLTYLYY